MRDNKNRRHGVVLYFATTLGLVSIVTVVALQFAILHERDMSRKGSQRQSGLGTSWSRGELASSALSSPFKRKLLPASILATRELPHMYTSHEKSVASLPPNITDLLTPKDVERAFHLCSRFLFSTLQRAVRVNKDLAEDVYVATGDIEDMWIRDSVAQMSIYLRYMKTMPWLRLLVEGAIRRNAFNILQDPYANSYERHWKHPSSLSPHDQVLGRGGFVATRNYELDSGAYFMSHLYDFYVTKGIYRPELLLEEPIIFQAVDLLVEIWILEQHHDTRSFYRYFELPNEGQGLPTSYTGMTWSGFRPSDDPCKYGYLIPANIHAAAALERMLILNERIWKRQDFEQKVSKLLQEMQEGINTYGIVKDKFGNLIYAYEVDGNGGILADFDDANVPSLLSIPLLGWSGYNTTVYQNTRKHLLSKANTHYYEGTKFRGVGSPHTPHGYVWPMAMVVEGLTESGEARDTKLVGQMKQLLLSASGDAMHESVHKDAETQFTRHWFEWANALFVVFVESTMQTSCVSAASHLHRTETATAVTKHSKQFLSTLSHGHSNDPSNKLNYQNVVATVQFE